MENFRLKVFRLVSCNASFSRAAEQLLLTQPAVSQQIKALEDEYGVPLFDRRSGRVQLTAAGAALLPFAERLKALSDEAFAAVANASGALAGELPLGASQTISQYLLPKFISGFLLSHPRVRVSARSGNTDAILDLLTAHEIDLALIEGPALRRDVHVEPFMQDEMVLVVPAGHAWADADLPLRALQDAPLLLREFGSGSRRVIERALTAAGLDLKTLVTPFELDSTEGLLSAVEAGLGVTFVSRWAVRNQLALQTLRLAYVRDLELTRMFSIAYAAGPEPSGAAGAMRQFLLDCGEKLLCEVNGRQVPS